MDGGGELGCDNCVTDVDEEERVDECTVDGEEKDIDEVDIDGVGECASTLSLLGLDFCLAALFWVFPSFGRGWPWPWCWTQLASDVHMNSVPTCKQIYMLP